MAKNIKKNEKDIWYVLGIVGQLGFIIAIPAAGLTYLGHLLDIRLETSPWLAIAGLGLAIFSSSMMVYQMIKKIEE